MTKISWKILGIFIRCWKESVCPGGSTEIFLSAPSQAKLEEVSQLKYGHFETLQDWLAFPRWVVI